ncbi:protein timeless homolog isoform X2 [Ambystoma mexicanum]|uniref:protein timeless homolog isoform X2 n=1 Tax=Ambystoma mexicanum TaxID=8296 RepID=UPI0037E76A96
MDLYMMNCELLATCSALGYLEGDTYHKEPECLESVKDLIRYLRHEDDARDIRQQLGAAQILQNDLVPLVIQHHQDKALFEATIRLMVNLTQPALLCFGKVPDDPTFRHHFLQVVTFLQGYKEAFANEKLFGVLSEKLYDLLQLDWEQREEEDNLLIERILLLVRNILHIPADPEEEKSVDDDASTHDKVLWAVHMSGMDDLVKFLASSQTEQQWTMHILEIVSLMFRDQKSEHLAATGQARAAAERGTDMKELELLRQREIAERKSRVFQRGSRHCRFGGSYVVQGLKSIGDRDVVFHKGLHTFKNYSHDIGKPVRRVPKKKQEAKETTKERRSALNVRLFLKEFCTDFLENCYNRLMYIVKDHLIRQKTQQHDETYYMWSMAFFMSFNRHFRFRPELVSETVSIRTFHFIEQNLTNYYEMMLMDKKEATSWSKRMHLALNAYQELLTTVYEMDLSKDEAVRESSKIIKNNIFYLMEYRELFLAMFRKFDETTQPRSFLKDLVETTHLFLKMLERFCKGKNNLVVQNKKRKGKKKKKKSKALGGPSEVQSKTPEQLEEIWQSLSVELSNCAKGLVNLPEDVMPFDAASEIPVEDQRAEAMVRIQDGLLANRGAEALSLLRTAREVWPEGDVFGSPDLDPEEEFQLLRQILFANLPRQTPAAAAEAEESDENGGEEEAEELAAVHVSEREFNFLDYLKRFATPNTIKTYVLLLKHYQENSTHTNHCVVKMLHRISYDIKMEGLLFQLSVFHLFNRIFSDPAASAYKELVTFAKYVVNKFFTLATTNNKAYVELLFWKNVAAVNDMAEGYQNTKEGTSGTKSKRVKWTPEEESQLRNLYLQFKEVPGIDVIDSILARLKTPNNRTRRQVILQLVQMDLANNAMVFKRERKGTGIVVWTEEQEIELQMLFEEYEGTDDVLGNIMKMVTAKRSRARIIDKLISMGLISDRKELHKKRAKKSKPAGMSEEEFLRDLGINEEDESGEDEDEQEEDESEEEVDKERNKDGQRQRRKRNLSMITNTCTVELDGKTKKLLHIVQQEGFSGPLAWLQNCLNRTAGDREEDGVSQAVPLVPLTEENEDAMENGQFQKLLKAVGVRPPANEQESFWRIPATLSPDQLRSTANFLTMQSPEEEDTEEVHQTEGTEVEHPEGGSGDALQKAENAANQDVGVEQRAEALRALLLARKKKPAALHPASPIAPAPLSEEDGLEVADPANVVMESDTEAAEAVDREADVALKKSSKRSRLIDSEDENDAPGSKGEVETQHLENEGDSDSEKSHRPTKRKRLLIEDEDDD